MSWVSHLDCCKTSGFLLASTYDFLIHSTPYIPSSPSAIFGLLLSPSIIAISYGGHKHLFSSRRCFRVVICLLLAMETSLWLCITVPHFSSLSGLADSNAGHFYIEMLLPAIALPTKPSMFSIGKLFTRDRSICFVSKSTSSLRPVPDNLITLWCPESDIR